MNRTKNEIIDEELVDWDHLVTNSFDVAFRILVERSSTHHRPT